MMASSSSKQSPKRRPSPSPEAGQAKSIRLSASSSTTSAETTSNAGLKKKSSSGSVHGRRDLRTRWFFDSSDDKIFVRKYGKTKETSVILFDGEPGEISGLEPSKSQSDTLKVRLKIPLPCAIDRASIAIGPFSEHVNADAVKKCRVYEKKSLASNGVSAGMYIEKSTQSGLLKIYKVEHKNYCLSSGCL